MIRSYFIAALRSLIHDKKVSAINIFGLGLGITCSLLILLWVWDEKKMDGFHTNGPNLSIARCGISEPGIWVITVTICFIFP